ncbi:hypothetical protein JTE90_001320 [Oedothorax gibbosus]|uniref:Uncharacterized protein n=1 Tax=Oedothorax gibbosus TaxID=931172 RepID=A0AAV6U3W3_9ARAC|nr:hypothetical protein JTE90_001320 [Oedothorax gibbosus]
MNASVYEGLLPRHFAPKRGQWGTFPVGTIFRETIHFNETHKTSLEFFKNSRVPLGVKKEVVEEYIYRASSGMTEELGPFVTWGRFALIAVGILNNGSELGLVPQGRMRGC